MLQVTQSDRKCTLCITLLFWPKAGFSPDLDPTPQEWTRTSIPDQTLRMLLGLL
jgi:hypothetical protein